MAGVKIDTSMAGHTISSNKTDSSSGSSLDKDAFLKLLVTQMQYQDPLEPTSNTEYMSQLAQFSSVEQLQNLGSILNVPDSSGNTKQVSGLVDYVTVSDGKTYFHIGDEYYDSSYLDSVVSLDYLEHLIKNDGKTDGDGTKTDDTAKKDNDNVDTKADTE